MTRRTSLTPPLALAALLIGTVARAQTGAEDEPLPPAFGTPGAAPGSVPGGPAGGPSAPTAEPAPPAAAPAEPVFELPLPPAPSESLLPSLDGPIGLYHLSTADVGPLNHLRLALHGQLFHATNFLIEGDSDTRLAGELSFGITVHPNLELFGALLNSSNRNDRAAEPDRTDPELIKSFGDLILGGKAAFSAAPRIRLGGEVGFRLLSAISDLAISPSSTSLWFGPLATFDLRSANGFPLRLHANLNFYLDNSGNLYDFTGRSLHTQEVAMFAYGIEDSRFRIALGADSWFENLQVPLQLFAEYHLEIVTSSPNQAFAAYLSPENRDQQWLTLGARARVFHGLTVDAGLDIGLQSVGYQFGPPLPPYDFIFGVGFPLDVDSFRRPQIVTQTIEKAAAPVTGTVAGRVAAAADGKPVEGAVVAFVGRPRARVATDPDGSFASGPLAPGPVELEVTAAGFESAKATATVTAGASAEVDIKLTAKILTGAVRGKVLDADGHGLAATVRFIGGATYETHSDAGGVFTAALPAGPYRVTADAPGLPTAEVPLDLGAGQDVRIDLRMRLANPDVTLTADAVLLRLPIRFQPGAPKLAPLFQHELDGVAELLGDHPELRLRIEANWNGPKGKAGAKAKALTVRQAAAIKSYLTGKGVTADRLEAVGRGGEVPLVPNLGPANQKKNRRVELIVFH